MALSTSRAKKCRYGETIQPGRSGGTDHVGRCTSVQGQLHMVFVIAGVKNR